MPRDTFSDLVYEFVEARLQHVVSQSAPSTIVGDKSNEVRVIEGDDKPTIITRRVLAAINETRLVLKGPTY